MFNLMEFIKDKFCTAETFTPEQESEQEKEKEYKEEVSEWEQKMEEAKEKAHQIIKDKYDGTEEMTKHQYNELFYIELNKLISSTKKPVKPLRVIRTARSLKSINEAVDDGFKPLIKKVEPSDKIKAMYILMRDKKTGKIRKIADERELWDLKNHEEVIGETYYYPYNFKSPFAAYLVPSSIKKGERVILEDLIEDYVGKSWQGNSYRLLSAEAVWNGKKFEIDYTDSDANVLFG